MADNRNQALSSTLAGRPLAQEASAPLLIKRLMTERRVGYSVEPFPRIRQLIIYAGRIARDKHTIRCLVEVDFDHDIIDGAPAARFMKRFKELIANGDVLT